MQLKPGTQRKSTMYARHGKEHMRTHRSKHAPEGTMCLCAHIYAEITHLSFLTRPDETRLERGAPLPGPDREGEARPKACKFPVRGAALSRARRGGFGGGLAKSPSGPWPGPLQARGRKRGMGKNKIMHFYFALCTVEFCKIMRNYAKLCEIMRNHAKLS